MISYPVPGNEATPISCRECGRGKHMKHSELVHGQPLYIFVCCQDPKHNESVDEELQAARADERQKELPL